MRTMTADGPIVHVRLSKASGEEILRRQKKLAAKGIPVSVAAIVRGIVEKETVGKTEKR